MQVRCDGCDRIFPDERTLDVHKRYYHDKQKPSSKDSGGCPECGGKIAREEGCQICHSCGWSKCG